MTNLEERLKQLLSNFEPFNYGNSDEEQRDAFVEGFKKALELPELKGLVDVLERSLYVRDFEAPEDSEVKSLGERIGFGALLDAAVKGWHQSAKEKGYPPGGAFTVGHCYTTVKSVLTQWREFVGKESETV